MVNLLKEFEDKKFLLKEETYKIIGACMEVHRQLGRGFLEVLYKEALEYEYTQQGIWFEREKEFKVCYKDTLLGHPFRADFIAYDKVILEVKAQKKGLVEENEKQLINYLAVSGCKVGLLINFGLSSLEYKRLVF